MKTAEIFRSVQGEGLLTGTESAFVRASGCNLRCCYCDTPYASWQPEGDDLSVDEIIGRVEALGLKHVVLTGGEPMLFAELIPLTARLKGLEYHVTVETAGTLYLPVRCDLMSISPKLSNSTPSTTDDPRWARRHDQGRHAPEVIGRLLAEYEYQLKFVIGRPDDCREVEKYLEEFPQIDRSRVMLMPQGVEAHELAERGRWLEPYCAEQELLYCARRQIEWFGLVRGK